MFYTYILRSLKYRRLYIGYTDNLRDRLAQHNCGRVKSTRPYIPWRIVYYEAYTSKSEAIKREHNLKLRANAWNQLRKRIGKSINFDAD